MPPPALSLIVTTPVRTPLATGVKVAAITQVPPAVTGVEVEQVVLGSRAKSPLAPRALMYKGLVPALVSVADWAADVVPIAVLPNVRPDGFKDTPGAVPVPDSAMFCVPPLALSPMITTPVREPTALGVKITEITQVPPATTGVEVEHVVPELMAKSPLAAMALMVSGPLPVFDNVTDCAVVDVPTTVPPKLRLEGANVTPGAVPEPLRPTTLVPTLEAMLSVPVRAPVADGVKVIPTAQFRPGVSEVEVEQVVVVVSTLKSPLAVKPAKLTSAEPLLVTVNVSAVLVVPKVWLPKTRFAELSATMGIAPEPAKVTT